MKAVQGHKAKYINAEGYWLSFNQSTIDLRKEGIKAANEAAAKRYDVWEMVATR